MKDYDAHRYYLSVSSVRLTFHAVERLSPASTVAREHALRPCGATGKFSIEECPPCRLNDLRQSYRHACGGCLSIGGDGP